MDSQFILLWEFQVSAGKRQSFERFYGSEGGWAQLFRSSKGFYRTELVRDVTRTGRYMTLDFWASQLDYEVFRRDHLAAYESLDVECEELTDSEIALGSFCQVIG